MHNDEETLQNNEWIRENKGILSYHCGNYEQLYFIGQITV
jgi:hypothetical protein